MFKLRRSALGVVALGAVLGAASVSVARPGPDVQYTDIGSAVSYTAVGGTIAYSLATTTCNIGNQNLLWTSYGTPAVGFNLYRLHNGRLEQIGLSFCKTACCAAAGSGCGPICNGQGGSVLGAGCRDVYGASYNGGQTHLAPRSSINAYTGAMASFPRVTGNTIFRRLQVQQADLSATTYPGALYFASGEYVGTDDAIAGNGSNNASYRRVTVNPSTLALTTVDATRVGVPAIKAWVDNGLGAGIPDPSVSLFTVEVPGEGTFWVATKVTTLASDRYIYDYAIFNLNSDRSGGSFTVPIGAGVKASNIGFHDVDYHSGEIYDNTDWSSALTTAGIQWSSPETYAQNPNSNALRWGTMYNFWFEATTPPTAGTATLGLFKPGTPSDLSFEVPVPTGGCPADWNHDGNVTSQDFFDFVAAFFNNNADFNSDGVTNSQDFFDFLGSFFQGC